MVNLLVAGNMTWKCEICGAERPDSRIKVLSYPLNGLPTGKRNLRYCGDNEACHKAALKKAETREV